MSTPADILALARRYCGRADPGLLLVEFRDLVAWATRWRDRKYPVPPRDGRAVFDLADALQIPVSTAALLSLYRWPS